MNIMIRHLVRNLDLRLNTHVHIQEGGIIILFSCTQNFVKILKFSPYLFLDFFADLKLVD